MWPVSGIRRRARCPNAARDVHLAGTAVLAAALLLVALPQADAAAAAELPSGPVEYKELDEVLVRGQKAERSRQKVTEWMSRLVGQFTFEGHVDPRGTGSAEDLLAVEGSGTCVGLGLAPAVQCEIRVRWPAPPVEAGRELPGMVSTLDPAMMLFGFEDRTFGIVHMLVDSKGMAEPASGLLYGDTLISKEPCVAISGNCQRIVRITASPDLKAVSMNVEIEIDAAKALTWSFTMRRVPGPTSGGE